MKKPIQMPVPPAGKPGPQTVDAVSLLWPRLMSVSVAANYLSCTPWHVEDLCRSGAIVAFKEGKHWAIDRHELDCYVSRRHADAEALLKDFAQDSANNKAA